MNVYDFDGTIFKGDSTKKFYFFCLRKKFSLIKYIFVQLWYIFLYVIKKVNLTTAKEKFFSYYFSLDEDERKKLIEEFWDKQRRNIKPWYLEQKKKDDVIISASPSFLLKPITSELKIKLVATEFDEKTGKIIGLNCKGKEKVERFKTEIKGEINGFYSDSTSDKYLARLAKEAYYVSGDYVYNWPNESLEEKEKITLKHKIRKLGKVSLISIGLLLGCMFVFYSLLTAVFAIPTAPMQEERRESFEYFSQRPLHEKQFEVGESNFSIIDNYTDYYAMDIATYENEESALKKALYAPGETNPYFIPYNNGYFIFLRPLYLFFNIYQIRILNTVLQALLVIGLMFLMIKKKLLWTAIAFFIAYMFMSPYTLMTTLSFAPDFYVTVIAMFVMVLFDKFLTKKKLYPYFFLLLGATIAFFDMLMFTLVVFGFPFVLYCSMHKEKTSRSIKSILSLGVMWVIGYITLIMAKYALLSVVEGKSMFYIFTEKFFSRTATIESSGIKERLSVVLQNLRVFSTWPYLVMLAITGVVVVSKIIKDFRYIDWKTEKKKMLPFLFICILPFVWYMIFSSHSSIHFWYTYRLLTMSIFAMCAYFFNAAESRKQSESYCRKDKKIRMRNAVDKI